MSRENAVSFMQSSSMLAQPGRLSRNNLLLS
jgi:hypothetical protein